MNSENEMRTLKREIKELANRVYDLEGIVQAYNAFRAEIVLDGFGSHTILGTGVPPIGTKFDAHKHTTDGGTYTNFEVIAHEWSLTDTMTYPDEQGSRTGFVVRVHTRRCE